MTYPTWPKTEDKNKRMKLGVVGNGGQAAQNLRWAKKM